MALALTLTLSAFAAQAQQTTETTTTTTRTTAHHRKSAAATQAQVDELKRALEAQQEQISQLSRQLQTRDQELQQLQQTLTQSQTNVTQVSSKADAAASRAAENQQMVTSLQNDVTDLKTNTTNNATALQETQKKFNQAIESPAALHYKGITITPGGFMAAETVWRQRALGSDINTPFNSVAMPGANGANVSEFYGSGRQSRVSLLAEGKINMAKLTGYVEADFLGTGITSNNNQSNSYVLRQRQVWGQAALNSGFAVTGGQMWSLVTETGKGLDNRSELPPMTIDPAYTVGFSWARQYGIRFTQNFHNHFWLGAAIENAQGIFSASGQAANFLLGSAGTSGGLFNPTATYTFNRTPDFIFKAAAESGFGHFELFGVVRNFRDRIFPFATASTPSALGATNFSTTTAGVGANARLSLAKKRFVLGAHFLGGDGMGRYGAANLPDITVNPDGTLATLKSYQALGTVEFHLTKLDWYFNGGGEFVGRHFEFNPKGATVGYGSPTAVNTGCYVEVPPGSAGATPGFSVPGAGFQPSNPANCNATTRNIIEGTTGFWYRAYKGPKGTIQFGPQYSYVVRNTWNACGSAALLGPCTVSHFSQPRGIQNMFLTSFRYYIP